MVDDVETSAAGAGIDSKVKEYVDGLFEEKEKEIKALTGRLKGLEFNPSTHYPRSTYSFVALNGPKEGQEWTSDQKKFFLFGMIPWGIQMSFIVTLIMNILQGGLNDTGGDIVVEVTRFVAILVFVFNPDPSLQDVVRSFNLWPDNPSTHKGTAITSVMQFLQGFLTVIGSMLLIGVAGNVFNVLLNFMAMGFVSAIASSTFEMLSSGTMGPVFAAECDRIANERLPKKDTDVRSHHRLMLAMAFILVSYCVPAIYFLVVPEDHCVFFKAFGWTPAEGSSCA